MNELPDIDMVYAALDALYRNPDPSSNQGASKWLGELQKSVRILKNKFIRTFPLYKQLFVIDICVENI